MKRTAASLLLLILLLLSSCSAESTPQKYRYFFFNTFDTIITVTGYTQDEETFSQYAALVESEMTRYHQIFDQYHAYDGVHNLYAVNMEAGRAPVQAEPELIELLLLVRQWRDAYSGVVNPAMGGVLSLWHDARTRGDALPDEAALAQAGEHMDYDQVVIDEEAQTVSFADPELSLDLGSVAKGYAAELVAQTLRASGWDSFILNAGGNVICGGAPLDGRDHWVVAIEDLDGVNTREKLAAVNLSIVTSGDYQRYFTVDGKRYHHIIDPTTLYPSEYARAVTILYPDSGLADFLSTTAFLLPYEESRALIESIPDAEGMWTLPDESVEMTEGFQALVDLAG